VVALKLSGIEAAHHSWGGGCDERGQMSTKIYEGYRFPVEHLNDFIDHVREHQLAALVEKVRALMALVPDERVREELSTWEAVPDDIEKVKQYIRWSIVAERLCEASQRPEKSLFAVDSGWNFWLHGRFVYAIPWGQEFEHRALELPYVEDFAYWDNTDPPENVSDEEWKRRGEIWEEVCLRRWNDRRLFYTVVDFGPGAHATSVFVRKALGMLAE